MRRVIFSRRWIGRHVLVLALFVGFLALGWWQYQRAEGGNGRSWGYTFMWPLFALFLIFFWWRMVQMDAAEQAENESADPEPEVALQPVASGPVRKELARRQAARARSTTALQEEPDEAMDAYNDYLARLNAAAAVAQIERGEASDGRRPRARSTDAAS